MALKLRGALLGAGNIALRSHVPQWARECLREDVEIVAIADLSPSNLARASEALPAARRYANAEELLEREDLDFCDICTPPFSHTTLVERAASRGLNIVCEKPLAPSMEETERIADAVRLARIVFQPCHQYHHSPQWLALRARLPLIGPVYFAEYDVQRMAANPGNANWSPTWRTDASLAGGGILVDHGAHIFYQLGTVLGEPRTVQATVRTLRHHAYEVEDTALVTLDYGSSLAHVRLSWAAQQRRIHFRFVGEAGEITGDDHGLRIHGATTEEIAFDKGMSQDSSHAEWYAPLFAGFVERVRSHDLRSDALDEAVAVTRLISTAYESSKQGRCLPLLPESLEPQAEIVESASGALVTIELTEAMPSAGPERRWQAWTLRGAGLLALVATLGWAFYDVRWDSLGQAMAQTRLGWIGLAAVLNLAVVYSQSARWLALVRPLSRAATMAQAFKAMIVGFAVSTVVPARAGELARVQWFGRKTGLSRVSVVGSVVLDHLVNAAGLLVGLALLPFLLKVPLWLRPGGSFALALFALGTCLVVALRPASAVLAEGAMPNTRVPLRGVRNVLASVRNGLVASRSPRALALSFGASLVAWGLEINVTRFSMEAVGLHLPVAAAILVLVAVNLALAIPFAPPGNIGTLEVGATLALLEFHVPKEQALAFALCYHLLQVVPIGLLGFGILSREMSPIGRRWR
jgi:uncharacterized protein (TIRG00374 family)